MATNDLIRNHGKFSESESRIDKPILVRNHLRVNIVAKNSVKQIYIIITGVGLSVCLSV